jgi:putative flavoprotein involved in K+ transport
VLVVGIGNSGAEIASELAERGAAYVAISIRTPPPIVPRDPFGMPVQRTGIILSLLPPRLADRMGRLTARLVLGDLTRYGLPEAAWWPYSAHSVPVIDVGFVREVKRGRIHVRPNVARLSHDGVVYVDGRAEAFDAVIAATGFKTGLDQVVDVPGALDAQGFPSYLSGRPTAYPGLYFMGYTHSLRGHLFEANRDSRRLARIIEGYLGD